MTTQQIACQPLSGFVGAEIQNVDLSQPITDGLLHQLQDALFNHGVIFFRNQELTPVDHIRVAECFSEIEVNRFFTPVEGYPQVAEVRKEPDQKRNIGGHWHSDHSYDVAPAMASMLYAIEVPPYGGDTQFASMYAAYEHLSDGLKQTLEGMKAWHGSAHVFGKSARNVNDGRIGGEDKVTDDILQPVVITHPESGRKALYVNPNFTIAFEGWTKAESQPLLDYLYQFATQPAFCCRFQWKKGSVAMWDNRATQHLAVNDYHGHRRLMHRITLKGVPLH